MQLNNQLNLALLQTAFDFFKQYNKEIILHVNNELCKYSKIPCVGSKIYLFNSHLIDAMAKNENDQFLRIGPNSEESLNSLAITEEQGTYIFVNDIDSELTTIEFPTCAIIALYCNSDDNIEPVHFSFTGNYISVSSSAEMVNTDSLQKIDVVSRQGNVCYVDFSKNN